MVATLYPKFPSTGCINEPSFEVAACANTGGNRDEVISQFLPNWWMASASTPFIQIAGVWSHLPRQRRAGRIPPSGEFRSQTLNFPSVLLCTFSILTDRLQQLPTQRADRFKTFNIFIHRIQNISSFRLFSKFRPNGPFRHWEKCQERDSECGKKFSKIGKKNSRGKQ